MRLAYKVNHAVDLDSEFIVAASVREGDQADPEGLAAQIEQAEDNLFEADAEGELKEVVTDKGYHKAEVLADAGFASNELLAAIRERGWHCLFAMARTRRLQSGKSLKDVARYTPHRHYRKIFVRLPNGRRRAFWVIGRKDARTRATESEQPAVGGMNSSDPNGKKKGRAAW